MRKLKKIIIILVILTLVVLPLTLSISSLLVSFSGKEKGEDSTSLKVLKDIYIPEELKGEGFGLFWLSDEDSEELIRWEDMDASSLDNGKPIQIYFSEQQDFQNNLELLDSLKIWRDEGYNVGIFNFAPFTIDDSVTGKIWGFDKEMSWLNAERQMVKSDMPRVSIAQMFSAYYLDFLESYDNIGEIRFSGSRSGGNLMYASTVYLISKANQGFFDRGLIPSRITYLSPQILGYIDYKEIDWLDKSSSRVLEASDTISHTEFMQEIGEIIAGEGIAIEVMEERYAGEDTSQNPLSAHSQYFEYQIDEQDRVEPLFCLEWYSKSLIAPLPQDYAMTKNMDSAFSARNPSSYVMAKKGIIYNMEKSSHSGNDIIYSTNIEYPTVSGYCFYDIDSSGVYNGNLGQRAKEIKVELYLKSGAENRLLGSYITDITGYYQINVPRIYANNFDTMFIKVFTDETVLVTRRADKLPMMNNDINPDNMQSDLFILQHNKSAKIINVGLGKGQ